MRSAVVFLFAVAALATAAEPPIPRPAGYVTDVAHVLDPGTTTRIERLVQELRDKTGAEIAVVTVETTAPLDDFTYAMRIADAWRPGRKGEDTGVVLLVATRDRKLRILVGYGLEGILPDGLVGEIEDREIVPAFRAGDVAGGVRRGVEELARRIAAARGVALTGAPPRAPAPRASLPGWVLLLAALLVVTLVLYQLANPPGVRRRRGIFLPPGGFGGFGGGFGGGGGGFGGFGGGGFGGGGAGRSW